MTMQTRSSEKAQHDAREMGARSTSKPNARANVWDWSHAAPDSKARALYTKAVSEQWQEDSLNWGCVIDPARILFSPENEPLLDRQILDLLSKQQQEELLALCAAEAISQTIHGEQGALLVSCQLVQSLPDKDAKLFAATQAMDEARHIDAFSRYILRLQGMYQPTATLRSVLEKVLSFQHWQGQMVGMHIMVEGLALANFIKLRASTTCPLLRDLLKFVMRDESRHVAFGNNYLKSVLDQMHPDDRAEVEDFAVDLVNTYRHWGRNADDWSNFFSILIQVGVDPSDYIKQLKSNVADSGFIDLAPQMMRGLEAIIMPGLQRVGLITERVRHRFFESELRSAADLRVLEDLEKHLLM